MVTLSDFMDLLRNPDRVRILRGEEEVFTGHLDFINGTYQGEDLASIGLTGKEPVKGYRAELEIRHRKWRELGLMKPLQPMEQEEYRFKDMMMSLYHVITI